MSSVKRLLLTILIALCGLASTSSSAAQTTDNNLKITAQNASHLKWQRALGLGGLINAAWSADGNSIFAVTNAGVYRYDSTATTPVLVSGTIAYTNNAYFSRDGHWLATTINSGSEVRITNLATGEYWAGFEELKSGWSKLYFGDGVLVALSQNNRLWLYDLMHKRILRVIEEISDVAVHPNGDQMAVSDKRGISLWDIPTLRETGRFSPRLTRSIRLAFSGDGRSLFTTKVRDGVYAFDVETRQQKYHLAVPGAGFALYDARGTTAMLWGAQSSDLSIQLVNLETGKRIVQVQATDTNPNSAVAITAAAISRDGSRVAALAWDGTLRVWDSHTGKQISEQTVEQSRFLTFSADGTKLLLSTASNLVLNDYLHDHRELLTGHYGYNVSHLAFSPNGHWLATLGVNGIMRLWNTSAWGNLVELTWPTLVTRIYHFSFSPDSRSLLVGAYKRILRHDLSTLSTANPTLHSFVQLGTATCQMTAYSGDGKLMACSIGTTVVVWNAETRRVIWDYAKAKKDITVKNNAVYSIAISPDNQQLALSLSPNRLVIVNLRNYAVKTYDLGISGAMFSLTYSPDSKLLAFKSSNNAAYVFDARTMQKKWSTVGLYREYDNARQFVAFSPDGALLAVSDLAQQIRLFEASTGQLVAELKDNTSGEGTYNFQGIAFSPDGTLLAGTTDTGMVMLWGITEQ
ncbi:MAG: PD40 domain-containing protein [Anaerolineae bacterium]|nr:PD40 domain-containing protein [Anaerolineae bacterium]